VDEAVIDDESDGASDCVVDPEPEDDEEDALVFAPVPANATPGVPAMPNPTPNATARAPTRPIHPAIPIVTTLPLGVTQAALHTWNAAVANFLNRDATIGQAV
jgi:hypothetical protein